jgi:predicted GIY-YIG superfamily endonuclease
MVRRCGLGPKNAPQGPRTGSTRFRRPLRLIYYEACLEAADAYRRERYLKTGKGKRYLRQRLKAWRDQFSRQKLERH